MITFILNDTEVTSTALPGTPLLDVIRGEYRLRGAKLACGEGECGACSVLIGELTSDGVEYMSVTSCITPLAHVEGKHVVTIEGLQTPLPGPVQTAMIACNGTQCGFCTPGFVVAMTGGLLGKEKVTKEELITAIDGNICRCTGYKSIERAAESVLQNFDRIQPQGNTNDYSNSVIVPGYFRTIRERLITIQKEQTHKLNDTGIHIGGGTDLYVQRPYAMRTIAIQSMALHKRLKGITEQNGRISVGAAETMQKIQNSTVLQQVIPEIKSYLAPVASTQIRNTATLGGNLVNASPIGDLTILFLALDADIVLEDENNERTMKLREFYLAYKTLAKSERSVVKRLEFTFPPTGRFHFERVCKRTYLDVASVNSACMMAYDTNQVIKTIHISAGGVAPIPKYLQNTSAFLLGKQISPELILRAVDIMQEEISPISDIRGSEKYKRLLLRQQFFIHMSKLASETIDISTLINK